MWHIERNTFVGNVWIKNIKSAFRIQYVIRSILQFRLANENLHWRRLISRTIVLELKEQNLWLMRYQDEFHTAEDRLLR